MASVTAKDFRRDLFARNLQDMPGFIMNKDLFSKLDVYYMRTLRSVIVLAFLLTMSAWAQDTMIIKGGSAVGTVRLGMSMAQVQSLLGAPSSVQSSPNDPQAKFLQYPSKGLAVFVGSNGVVIGITVTGGKWHTPEGIGVGSAGDKVYKTYGQGLQRGQGNVNYASRGLAFSIRNGKVVSVFVFKPEDDKALMGDRIIVPGQRVGGLKIGMKMATVEQAWGAADKVLPMGNNGRAIHRYKEEAIGLIVCNGIVEGMVIETGDFITSHGVKVGSSKAEVVKAFGQGAADGERLLYEKKGIGFMFTAGRVRQITVLAP